MTQQNKELLQLVLKPYSSNFGWESNHHRGRKPFIIQGKKEKVRLKPQKSPVLLLTLQKHSEATSLTM